MLLVIPLYATSLRTRGGQGRRGVDRRSSVEKKAGSFFWPNAFSSTVSAMVPAYFGDTSSFPLA